MRNLGMFFASVITSALLVSQINSADAAVVGPYGLDGTSTVNSGANSQAAENQITFSVSDMFVGTGDILFSFFNTGSVNMFIGQIYFDDMSPLFSSTNPIDRFIQDGTLVEFEVGTGNTPEPNQVTPSFGAEFSADANNPAPQRGVNPGESLGIVLNFASASSDLSDVVAALASGDLRLSFHIQGFAGGGSETLVNNTNTNNQPPAVPLPAAGWLLIAGLGGLAAMKRRKTA